MLACAFGLCSIDVGSMLACALSMLTVLSTSVRCLACALSTSVALFD